MQTTATLSTSVLKKAIDRYYKELQEYKGRADYELATRTAFLNLLAESARHVKWLLIPEQTIEGNIRPDGVLRDSFDLKRGFWEAKGPKSDLDREIVSKIAAGYPLTNTIFENTKRAVLYQNEKRVPFEFDLQSPSQVGDLLTQFFTYTKPDVALFEVAVKEFKERVPEQAGVLLAIIEREYKQNRTFITAFDAFAELCRTSLDPKIGIDVIKEMLIQHLLTERLFTTVFDNPDFIRRNAIAAEIEKVIDALTSRSFNRHEFLKPLDRFYVAIEGAAKSNGGWLERQHFLDIVYERFFQGYSVKRADTYGIVYTPQEIVDFMCASVNEILKCEFSTSIDEPGVQIIDPCVGTGSYIVNLLHRIPNHRLKYKYEHDLFCNEIMLLPYYISSLNIEHEYYNCIGVYEPFEGICFADTLELIDRLHVEIKYTDQKAKTEELRTKRKTVTTQQNLFLVEENTRRVQREKNAQIMVVIGNPPYNVGQRNENDNNKNRRYPVIDGRIRETYVKDSKATNRNSLSDAYIRFFRWATDRLQGHDGIVCFVSNNGFFNGIASDGFRKHLLKDFNLIYHFDFKGDARTSGERRKAEGGNIFDDKIREGVGITLLVRASHLQERKVYYHCVGDYWRAKQKRQYLSSLKDVTVVPWQQLIVDDNHNWLLQSLPAEFSSFLSLGTKEAKATRLLEISKIGVQTIFKLYSRGAETTRDSWMYDFNPRHLTKKAMYMIETYNAELSRWIRAGSPKNIDDFVLTDDTKIKWSSRLKECLVRKIEARFQSSAIRNSLYRPFTRQFLYFDSVMTHRQGMFPFIFPTPFTEVENIVICVSGIGSNKPFHCLASNIIPCLDLLEKTQCFPFYTYSEDGGNRRENITDWVLSKFQAQYGFDVTKWDIFHYVYAMLHHPQYRECYAENLKRDLPHIPLLNTKEAFLACVLIGKQLIVIHLNYEQAEEYQLKWIENHNVPFSWRVKKIRLTPDKTAVIVNESLTLAGIPQECFLYRLGNRSALDWIIDQYRISEDKRTRIVSDPNNLDDEEYIVRLIGKVITVSIETVQLVNELSQAVKMEDWMSETVEESQ